MPEDRNRFDRGDYVEVKDRIAKFYELFGQGRLVTGEVRLVRAALPPLIERGGG